MARIIQCARDDEEEAYFCVNQSKIIDDDLYNNSNEFPTISGINYVRS